MKRTKTPTAARIRRHRRLRRKISGTPARPRLAVFRSLNHIYAQVIDDSTGRTIVAASDLEQDLRGKRDGKNKTEVAGLVGEAIASKAVKKGIKTVVLDRGGFKYQGRIKALAEAARKGRLSF
ncbi:MAG: 50S ribosomal protein L18 [Chloroflexi bacterium RBG_16_64_32]|nr:MAG: 50S ribosomal protein L18 [Chloroflexi bacterium RBG_16_64_32]